MATSHVEAPDSLPAVESVLVVLGGRAAWGCQPKTWLEVHDAIVRGIRWSVANAICMRYPQLDKDLFFQTIGVSSQAVQRKKTMSRRSLTVDQGERLWRLGEALAKAEAVLGTRKEAISWLKAPAMGLDQRTPIGLLTTSSGAELVGELLNRMDYGVYS